MTTKQQQAVINYYNHTKREYRILWRSNHGLALHFGYYDKTVNNHDQAVLKLNQKLAEVLGINGRDSVLDAGCGLGGSAIWLAENLDCQVTGINITPWQVEYARNQAKNRGLTKSVDFILGDYSATNLASESFSVVWGVESIVHAESKPAFVSEALRLLKPGGQLMISEYLLTDNKLDQAEQKIIKRWLAGWAMPSLMSESQYRQILTAAGFKNVKAHDWTKQVRPSLNRLNKFARLIKPIAPALSKLHLINQEQLNNLDAFSAQMTALDKGLWRYKVVTAHKPS